MYTPREWPHPSISQSNTPQSPPGGGGQLRRAAQARQDWLSRLHLSQPTLSHLAFPSPLTRVHHHHPTTSQPQNEPSHADFHEYLVSQGKTSFLHRPNQPHPFKVARLHRRLPPDGIFKGGRETPIDSQPHPSDWNTAFREALDEEGRPLKDDDGDLLYRDRAGNSVRSHRVRGLYNGMRQTREPDHTYLCINGIYTLYPPSSSFDSTPPPARIITTKRQRVLNTLNEAIDAGPDRSKKPIFPKSGPYKTFPFDYYPPHGYLHRLSRSHIVKWTPEEGCIEFTELAPVRGRLMESSRMHGDGSDGSRKRRYYDISN